MKNNEEGCFMKRFGCRLCNVGVRRKCCEWKDKVLLTAFFVALTYFFARCMPDASTVNKSGIVLGVCFYVSVIFNAGWFFYLFAPWGRR